MTPGSMNPEPLRMPSHNHPVIAEYLGSVPQQIHHRGFPCFGVARNRNPSPPRTTPLAWR